MRVRRLLTRIFHWIRGFIENSQDEENTVNNNTDFSDDLPAGSMVKAALAGPSFGNSSVTLTALPNQTMEIPKLGVPGDHYLYNIRLEDAEGNIILSRDPALDMVVINVDRK